MDDFVRYFKSDNPPPPPPPPKQSPPQPNISTDSLQKRIQHLEYENKNLRAQITDLQKENNNLNRAMAILKSAESVNLQNFKQAQSELIQQLKFEIKSLNSQLVIAKNSNDSCRDKYDELWTKYHDLLDDFESEKHASKFEINRLNSLVDKLTREKFDLLNVHPEKMDLTGSTNFKNLSPDEQFRLMLEGRDNIRAEEVEIIAEKNREIADLKSEIKSLKLKANSSTVRNFEVLKPNSHQKTHQNDPLGQKLSHDGLYVPDMRFFKGNLLENNRQGFGLSIGKDNRVAIGRFEGGQLQGFGKLLIADQMIIGNFVNGTIDETSCKIITLPIQTRIRFNDSMDYEGETCDGVIEGKGKLFFKGASYFEGYFKGGVLDTSRRGILQLESNPGFLEIEVSAMFFAEWNTTIFSASNGLTFACNFGTGLLESQN
jgi:hypothetical protein